MRFVQLKNQFETDLMCSDFLVKRMKCSFLSTLGTFCFKTFASLYINIAT